MSPRILRLFIFFITILVFYFIFQIYPAINNEFVDKIRNQTKKPAEITKTVFEIPNTEAKAVVVYNANKEEIIYEKNGDTILPLASITKLVTALSSSNVLSPDTIITISEADLNEGSNAGLLAGTSLKYQDLLDIMLITSSNGSAKAISRATENLTTRSFISLMNQTVSELGLTKMKFYNETGLDLYQGGPGATGSAIEVAKLFTYIAKHKPDLTTNTKLPIVNKNTLGGFIYQGNNTNTITKSIPGFLGSKTGFTDLAGGNLAVMLDGGLNNPIIIVVLGSSHEGRFDDMEKLINSSLKYLANQ